MEGLPRVWFQNLSKAILAYFVGILCFCFIGYHTWLVYSGFDFVSAAEFFSLIKHQGLGGSTTTMTGVDKYGVASSDSFVTRSTKLMMYFFKSDGLLAKRLPQFYGPHCAFSYLYKLYSATFVGFLAASEFPLFAVSAAGFVVNAVAVTLSIGVYGGLTKLTSIPHMLALGTPAYFVARRLLELECDARSLSWITCVCALAFYVPTLIVDVGELFQVFVQQKYLVLMPDGVVHPLKGWFTVDTSVKLGMDAMFKTATKAE